jgi:cytoskeletal protein RodZ
MRLNSFLLCVTLDEDEIIQTYDENKEPEEDKTDEEKQREEEEKEDAYRKLLDQLDLLKGDESEDYHLRESAGTMLI